MWKSLGEDWIKINIDGGKDNVTGSIYVGGVMRDNRGKWHGGFSSNKWKVQLLKQSYRQPLRVFLQLAWKSGFRCIILESDSTDSVNLLLKETNINHPLFNLISQCNLLIKGDWKCEGNHIFREDNMVADFLAGLGKNRDLGIDFHLQPPFEVSSFHDLDTG
ncbi:hypothetical protein ACOSP7_002559 [Xanthoceras sorbifolium]